jgi:hypothetical protein
VGVNLASTGAQHIADLFHGKTSLAKLLSPGRELLVGQQAQAGAGIGAGDPGACAWVCPAVGVVESKMILDYRYPLSSSTNWKTVVQGFLLEYGKSMCSSNNFCPR